jgi:hypothetical protein
MAQEQEDSVAIAQSGINPLTGSPLSSEQRKSLFRKVSAPSSILGQGGALVKRTEDSSSLVVAQTQQITSLQDQLNVIRAEVSVLNTGLQSINKTIQQGGILEQQRLQKEQQSEQKNLETKVRVGKENQLEQKIQSSLAKPIVSLQKKVSNIFSRIFEALTTLFMGWLTNQGIETLKAYASGNKEKLEQIKDNVIKNVLFAVGAIAAIKIGFNLIIRTVIGLAARVGGIATRLALAPFRLLGGQLAKVPLIGNFFGGNNAAKAGKAAASTAKNTVRNVFSRAASATKGVTAGALKTGGSVVSKFFAPLNIGIAGVRFSTGDPVGGSLSAAAAIPGLGLPAVAFDVAREMGFGKGTWFGKKEETTSTAAAAPGSAAAAPGSAAAAPGSAAAAPGSAAAAPGPAAPQSPMMSQAPAAAAPGPAAPQSPMMSQAPAAAAPGPAAPQSPMMSQAPAATVSPTTPMAGSPKPEPPPTIVGPIEEPAAAPQSPMMSQAPPTSTPGPAAQPQTPAIPPPSPEMVKNFEMAWKYKDNSMLRGRIESAWNNMTVEQQQQAKSWAKSTDKDWTQMKLIEKPITSQPQSPVIPQAVPLPTATSTPVTTAQPQIPLQQMNVNTQKAYTIPSLISADQIQTTPTQLPNIGNVPEPQPNVVMLPSQQPKNNQSMISPSSAGSNPPSINSANPDNFYVLYSQLNYNVVM